MRKLALLLICSSSIIFASEPKRLMKRCIDAEMTEFLRNRLANAEVIETPFPHIILEDFFPEDFYN